MSIESNPQNVHSRKCNRTCHLHNTVHAPVNTTVCKTHYIRWSWIVESWSRLSENLSQDGIHKAEHDIETIKWPTYGTLHRLCIIRGNDILITMIGTSSSVIIIIIIIIIVIFVIVITAVITVEIFDMIPFSDICYCIAPLIFPSCFILGPPDFFVDY